MKSWAQANHQAFKEKAAESLSPVDTVVAPLARKAVVAIPERDVLKAVLLACSKHPSVVFAHRMNSGMMKKGPHYVRFGFPGCPDVWGMLRGGTSLFIECKTATGPITEEQVEFLGLASRNGAVAFVARSADDVWRGIPIDQEAA